MEGSRSGDGTDYPVLWCCCEHFQLGMVAHLLCTTHSLRSARYSSLAQFHLIPIELIR